MSAWTRMTASEEAANALPAWFASRMTGLRGKFGLLLTTGDVLKITSIVALHQSSHGAIILDVLLDDAGVPDAVDLAWRSKHYLGAPVPGATMATVNAAHVVAAVEFTAEIAAEQPDEDSNLIGDEIEPEAAPVESLSETFRRANEVSV
jgi:hypothetical protein